MIPSILALLPGAIDKYNLPLIVLASLEYSHGLFFLRSFADNKWYCFNDQHVYEVLMYANLF